MCFITFMQVYVPSTLNLQKQCRAVAWQAHVHMPTLNMKLFAQYYQRETLYVCSEQCSKIN